MDAYNDSDQTGATPAPATGKPFGIVGRKVRAIFAATTQHAHEAEVTAPAPQQAPASTPPTEPESAAVNSESTENFSTEKPSLVIIRNCSTRQVLDALLADLGGAADVSGRYFAPAVQDADRIREVAAAHELFTKESRIRDVLVLDLMVDRTIHPTPPSGRGSWRHRRDRGAPRDED